MKSIAGRPTKLTNDVVKKLEEAFKYDFTIDEACYYAGISRESYYNYCEKDKTFLTKMDAAKAFVAMAAKKNVARAITDENSIENSWKYLQKRQPDLYSEKQKIETNSAVTLEEVLKSLEEQEDVLGENYLPD